MLVIEQIDNLDIYLPAAPGAARPAGYRTELQLTAKVFHDDNSQSSFATWKSDQPSIASVSSSGLVKAVGRGSGKGPWTVIITAESWDKKASAQREIVVHEVGDIELTVE